MGNFKRYDGFVMHIPQEFIDSHLPVCPFCSSPDPHWLLDSRMEMSLAGSRTYYRCERCGATLSSTGMDAAAENGRQFAFSPGAAALNAASKGMKHQEVGVTYLRVEELGSVSNETYLLNTEEPVEFFRQMAELKQSSPEYAQAPVRQPAYVQPSYPQPAAAKPAEPSNPLVWGILGLAFAFVMPILGLIFSIIGKKKSGDLLKAGYSTGAIRAARGLSTAGLICSIIVLAVAVTYLVFFLIMYYSYWY